MWNVKSAVKLEPAIQAGCTGRGVGVAILDTGAFAHADFADRVACFQDFVLKRRVMYDDNGHGTHVAGIIAGSGALSGGRLRGMAPGCHLAVIKVLDKKGNGKASAMIQGIDWLLKYKEEYELRIVNISVGGNRGSTKEDSLLVGRVEALWEAGLVVVVAAGNRGPRAGSITTPGISRRVITVGAGDDQVYTSIGGTRRRNYSGRGPAPSGIMKPELSAPGAGIMSCNVCPLPDMAPYTVKGGTSMSTAIVSGALALLLEKEPSLTNEDIRHRLKTCCDTENIEALRDGWGHLNVSKLLELQS